MTNPQYLVNIVWYPGGESGQQLVNIGGVTQSMITYSQGYFMASMPEAKFYATGSSYTTALTSLLLVASEGSIVKVSQDCNYVDCNYWDNDFA